MGVTPVRIIFELVRVFFSQIIFELVAGISCRKLRIGSQRTKIVHEITVTFLPLTLLLFEI